MEYVLDMKKPHQKYFEEISRIPRMSFREQAVSDYITAFAKERGLWFHQDPLGNVIVKKPGAKGYGSEPVMLQAHLDMVCEKEPGSDFDFLNDSIRLITEDGWVKAQSTTLGADDGAGAALMLAVLDNDEIKHPPLECVFTVQEEDGMGGACNLDYSKLTARKLIALDGLEEGTTIITTTGIHSGYVVREFLAAPDGSAGFLLKVSGLRGGHAALNIGKGQGNAIKITAEVLAAVCAEFPIRLASITGGTILNGIPQSCETLFTLSGNAPGIGDAVQKTVNKIRMELKEKDPGLTAELTPVQDASASLEEGPTRDVIGLIHSLPVGVRTWSVDIPDFPAASQNLGTISTEENRIKIGYSCRGISNDEISDMVEQTIQTAERYHAVYQEKFHYSGYTLEGHSPLISIWAEVYKEAAGKELLLRRIHSGTDAGTIAEHMGGMDIIVLMPNTRNVHTPDEKMELASFDRTCQYLFQILGRIR